MKLTLLFRSLKNFLVAMVVLGSVSSSALASYSQVIFFGDSLTDTGNLYATTGIPASPPYYSGSFSNGPLWSQTLSSWLGSSLTPSVFPGGNNYAWAGATVIDYNRPIPLIPQQLANYYLPSTQGKADPSALYVILGGANDVNEALALNDPATAATNMVAAAYAIDGMVDALYAAGARNVLVGNLPDIGLTPLAIANGAAAAAGASALSSLFNSTLQALLAATDLADVDLELDTFDLFGLLQNAVSNPSAYGFTNVTDPCLDVAKGTLCTDPDSYLFWDTFHPTAAAHRLIAQTAFSAIPEPSAWLLVALALMALLWFTPSLRGTRMLDAI